MRCYYHPDRPAVGLCRHCQRGLCMECGALVEEVLACKDHHEGQVQKMLAWQHGGLQQLQRLAAGYRRSAIFYGLVGGVFAAFGLYQYRFLGLQAVLLVLIGLFLLYASVANLVESRKDQ